MSQQELLDTQICEVVTPSEMTIQTNTALKFSPDQLIGVQYVKILLRNPDGTFTNKEIFMNEYLRTKMNLRGLICPFLRELIAIPMYQSMCVDISRIINWKYPIYNLPHINEILRIYDVGFEIQYRDGTDQISPTFQIVNTAEREEEKDESKFDPYAPDDPNGKYPDDTNATKLRLSSYYGYLGPVGRLSGSGDLSDE